MKILYSAMIRGAYSIPENLGCGVYSLCSIWALRGRAGFECVVCVGGSVAVLHFCGIIFGAGGGGYYIHACKDQHGGEEFRPHKAILTDNYCHY